jgi:hypothetical protein
MTEITDERIRQILADANEEVPRSSWPDVYRQVIKEELAALCRRALEAGEAERKTLDLDKQLESCWHSLTPDGQQCRDYIATLRADRDRLAAENARLKDWYDSIMDALESEGSTLPDYWRCGTCGGPVARERCCAWCNTNDTTTPKGADLGPRVKIRDLEAENARLREQLAAAILEEPECSEGCRL